MIKLSAENVYRTKYEIQVCADMSIRRGCAVGVYHYGQYYVFGGLNYASKILKSCEKYSESKWT